MTDEELMQSYKIVFGSAEGREVLKHLLATCCVDEPTYDQNGKPENTFYNEGRRSVALLILRMLERSSILLTYDLLETK